MSLLLALLLLGADGGVPKVDAKNWEHHPRIEAARAVYAAVRAALDAKALSTRELTDCTQEFSGFSISTDAQGVVRLLVRDFGGGDSSQKAESYYDEQGRLRFVFVKVGAVPSAWVEARWWLDETGAWTRHSVADDGSPLEDMQNVLMRQISQRKRGGVLR